MSDTIVVQTTAAGAGASVAVEQIGSTAYQFMKLVDGSVSAVTPIVATSAGPAFGTAGLVVTPKTYLAGGYFAAVATSTALSSSTQVLLQSVYVSQGSTLATSAWTVGAGSALMIHGVAFGWSQAAANNQATFAVVVTASGATLSLSAAPHFAEVTFSSAAALSTVLSTGFVPGSLVAANTSLTTMPFPWIIPGPAVVGMAVAVTSSGATAFAIINASIVATIPYVQYVKAEVSGSVTIANATTAISGTVAAQVIARTAVFIYVSSTVLGSVGTTVAFTINQGVSQTTAATTSWVVPGGQTFRIVAVNFVGQNSITTTPVLIRGAVLVSTALPTMIDAACRIAEAQVLISTTGMRNPAPPLYLEQDVPAGATIAMGITVATSTGSIPAFQVMGYLFP